MTKLPNIHAMDPDQWLDEVYELAERLEDEIKSVLDKEKTQQAAEEALSSVLAPYYIDPEDGTLADQLLVWVDEDDVLCIGVPDGDYAPVIYHDELQSWWYDSDETGENLSPAERHRQVAQYAVACTAWGEAELSQHRADSAKRERRLATPYLEKLEEMLQSGDPTAADLRSLLREFLHSCSPADSTIEIQDTSPDEHRTHFQLQQDDEVVGNILAVDPGQPIDWSSLSKSFEVDRSKVFVATDHIRFTGLMAGGGIDEPWVLRLPSEKDSDLARYNNEIGRMVMALRSAMATK